MRIVNTILSHTVGIRQQVRNTSDEWKRYITQRRRPGGCFTWNIDAGIKNFTTVTVFYAFLKSYFTLSVQVWQFDTNVNNRNLLQFYSPQKWSPTNYLSIYFGCAYAQTIGIPTQSLIDEIGWINFFRTCFNIVMHRREMINILNVK